jgi:hypothetical protein
VTIEAQPGATVISVQSRWVTTAYGDRIIRTRAVLRDDDGRVTVTDVVGGTLDGTTLVEAHTPFYVAGERVHGGGGSIGAAFLGGAWPTSPVRYVIDPTNADVPADAALTAILVGASAWTTQAAPHIAMEFTVGTGGGVLAKNGRNDVFFRPASSGSLIAGTYYWFDANQHLVDTDIEFYDLSIRFYAGSVGCAGSFAAYIEDIAAHEFGHTLGLAHSTETTATMYPTMNWCSQGWRTLAADDIAGVEALYPAPPPAAEVCGDGLDNDGDGLVDEGCATPTPTPRPCNKRAKKCQ